MVEKADLIAWVESDPVRLAKWNSEEGDGGQRSIADYLDEYGHRANIVNDLARDLGYFPDKGGADLVVMPRQSQETVAAWCNLHYAGESRPQLVRNLVEEVGELANETGADVEDLVRVLRASMARPKDGTEQSLRGEVGDVMIAVYNLADDLKQNADACLDEKMAKLSTRTVAQSQERVARKVSLGIRAGGEA